MTFSSHTERNHCLFVEIWKHSIAFGISMEQFFIVPHDIKLIRHLFTRHLLHCHADEIENVIIFLIFISESSIEWRTLNYIISVRNMHQTMVNRTLSRLWIVYYKNIPSMLYSSAFNDLLFFFFLLSISITGSIAFPLRLLSVLLDTRIVHYFNCDSVYQIIVERKRDCRCKVATVDDRTS